MINRTAQSALLVAGAAAAGIAAAAWFGRRRSSSAERATESPFEADDAALESSRHLDRGMAPSLDGALLSTDERFSAPIAVDDGFDTSLDEVEVIEAESAELPIGRSADPDIDASLSRTKLPQDPTSGGTLYGDAERPVDESPADSSLDEVWNALPASVEGEQSEGYDALSPEDLGSVWLERATETTHGERPHRADLAELALPEDLGVSEATLASSHLLDEEDDDEIAEDDLDLDIDDARDTDPLRRH